MHNFSCFYKALLFSLHALLPPMMDLFYTLLINNSKVNSYVKDRVCRTIMFYLLFRLCVMVN